MMRILVCDDVQSNCEKAQNAIRSRGEVEGLSGTKLKNTLTSFFNNVSRVLDSKATTGKLLEGTEFDNFDLLIVDNDLTKLELDGVRLTAETIIGYLRAFTDVSYIVSLNKNPPVDFDLRYLFGDYQSLADLALNTRHLSHAHLWERNALERFAPWYWPHIPDAVDRRRKQIDFLATNFATPVWKALDFPSGADEYLSPRAGSQLLSGKDELREAWFEVFYHCSRTLPPGEKDILRDLATNGVEFAKRAIHRISAYEVDRWLRCDVLGTQDVLIDLPHLVAQMPFLLGEHAHDLDCWNEVAASVDPPFGLDEPLFENHLKPAHFGHSMWTPGPCFWWPTLRSDDVLTKCFFDASRDWPNAAFCEDISQFVPIPDEGAAISPKEFEAEIEGSWKRRYIAYVENLLYSPRSRILGSAM